MQQLSLFNPTPAPAKVLPFRPVAPKPEPQVEGVECIYPQPKYGVCRHCESVILIPGLDANKCSSCGWIGHRPKSATGQKNVTSSKSVPTQLPAVAEEKNVTSPEPTPDPETNDAPEPLILPVGKELEPETKKVLTTPPAAKGKVLSMFTTRTRAEKMGRPDPFLAGIKVCTRRIMAESTAAYYQRAFESGQTIQIYSSGQYAGGIKWADVRLTRAPYQQVLKDIQPEDLVAEGDLWETKEEFIADLCLGRPDPEISPWVLWFEVVKMYV